MHNNRLNNHIEVGKMGEGIARKFLEKQGYEIIEQNYKTKYAEIDLVAKKPARNIFGIINRSKEVLVFVEVRTKIGENFGSPEETINKKKIRKLWGNAMAYAAAKKWKGPFRIDAICVVLKPDCKVERLNHYENIV